MLLQIIVEVTVLMLIENSYLRQMSYIIKRRFYKASTKEPDIDLQIQKEKFYGDIEKDSDVIEEENRISNTIKNNNCTEFFAVDKLVKYYSNSFVAVKGISFGINSSECFGLLGVNGAGKTSTFKMITGDEYITEGDVYLNNSNIKNDLKNVNLYFFLNRYMNNQ
jgi:ABC-type glutathione transport system ATPase component